MPSAAPLPRSFYDRDPREVAPALLGKLLVRREGRKRLAGRIVEVEADLGADDLAAHAAAGPTERNAVLYGPPGHAYVYFIYGAYFCLNVSCMREGDAGCVLIRALEPASGIDEMAAARGVEFSREPAVAELKKLTSGPGRLCDAFDITRERDNGKDLTSGRSDLQIVDDGAPWPPVLVTARIGITKDEHLPLRYIINGNPFISGTKGQNERLLAAVNSSK